MMISIDYVLCTGSMELLSGRVPVSFGDELDVFKITGVD